jgi:hypothetical protein
MLPLAAMGMLVVPLLLFPSLLGWLVATVVDECEVDGLRLLFSLFLSQGDRPGMVVRKSLERSKASITRKEKVKMRDYMESLSYALAARLGYLGCVHSHSLPDLTGCICLPHASRGSKSGYGLLSARACRLSCIEYPVSGWASGEVSNKVSFYDYIACHCRTDHTET